MKYHCLIFFCLFHLSCTEKKIQQLDDNGNLIEEYYITHKQKNGSYRSFYASGNIKEESQYDSGVLSGRRVIYYENGKKEMEEVYNENGTLDGTHYSYYPSGKLMIEKKYVENVLTGILKSYFPDGKIKEQVTMANNEENGPFTEYFQNGRIHWKGTYRNGDNEYGILYEYDSMGCPIKIMKCDSMAICRTIWKPGQTPINVDTVHYE